MHDPFSAFDESRPGLNAEEMNSEMRRRAGALVPHVSKLADTVWSDMDHAVFGVRWWKGQLDDRSRVLVSDHLVQSITSVADNLLEAGLHKVQALHALDAEDARFARVVSSDGSVKFPAPKSPRDVLNDRLIRMNVAGFFRGLGSTLDCLAATAIGVLGLRQNILKADFKRFRTDLARVAAPVPVWATFATAFEGIMKASGPAEWDSWVSDYRNMLVHRARRLEFATLKPERTILDARSKPVLKTTVVPHLVRDPALSDIEAFARQIGGPPCNLEEHARKTLPATFEAVSYVANEVASLLLGVWEERRRTPGLIQQPSEQWSGKPADRLSGFDGFAPRSEPFDADAMVGDPVVHDRIRNAALDDSKNALWKGYL